jgi:hypothetical protein
MACKIIGEQEKKQEHFMNVFFKEEKQFKACYGDPPNGNFALEFDVHGRVHWDHCREQFAAKFNETIDGFFFSHPEDKSVDIAAFIRKFEIILDINESEFSQFSKTNKNKIIWIQPSIFWRNCVMKRSLLTILMRCAINYNHVEDNFDEALFSEQYKENLYLRESRSATLRFMFGFTNFVGQLPVPAAYSAVLKHGWKEEFFKQEDSVIKKKLLLPKNQINKISSIDLDAIWN